MFFSCSKAHEKGIFGNFIHFGQITTRSATAPLNFMAYKTLHHKTPLPSGGQYSFGRVYGPKYKNYFFFVQVLKA